jgi:toluene monooxygenase system protein E
MNKFRTYSLLGPREQPPSEYEQVTSRLLYHVGRGFEVNVPIRSWYERHQKGSPLACPDWDRFLDPRATTYTLYTRLQKAEDGELEAIFEEAEQHGAPAEREEHLEALAPLRFPLFGLHMLAAYVAQMAPSGRIVMCGLFQAADEQRRLERFARRMRQIQIERPDFGGHSRGVWQNDRAWQPLRETVECMLVAYDWGEAFTALNLCLKPALDALILEEWALSDRLMSRVRASCAKDAMWHRSWSSALVRLALDADPKNAAVLEGWIARWAPRAMEAVEAVLPWFTREAGARERIRAAQLGAQRSAA